MELIEFGTRLMCVPMTCIRLEDLFLLKRRNMVQEQHVVPKLMLHYHADIEYDSGDSNKCD